MREIALVVLFVGAIVAVGYCVGAREECPPGTKRVLVDGNPGEPHEVCK